MLEIYGFVSHSWFCSFRAGLACVIYVVLVCALQEKFVVSWWLFIILIAFIFELRGHEGILQVTINHWWCHGTLLTSSFSTTHGLGLSTILWWHAAECIRLKSFTARSIDTRCHWMRKSSIWTYQTRLNWSSTTIVGTHYSWKSDIMMLIISRSRILVLVMSLQMSYIITAICICCGVSHSWTDS